MGSGKIFFIPAVILCFFSGCEFVPHEVPETVIDPPSIIAPPIFINLNDYNDTIRLGWLTDFTYSVSGGNALLAVKIAFEGDILVDNTVDNISSFRFSLDPFRYSNGLYELNIEIITGSGTGSIADKLGAEGYFYQLSWPVYIDNTLPEGIYNYEIDATPTAKGMELSWPSFNHCNFVSYVIYRENFPFERNGVAIAEITDPLDTTFIDTTYWEGHRFLYYLGIKYPGGIFNANSTWITSHLTGFKAEWQPDGTVDVEWDKARNLESFGMYNICSSYGYGGKNIEEYYIEDPNQNYITLQQGGFGKGLYVFLRFIPIGVEPENYGYLRKSYLIVEPEKMIPNHLMSYYVNGRDFVILSGFETIYRYHPHDIHLSDSISGSFDSRCILSVSNDGNRFAYFQDGNYFIRNTDDFTLINEFPGPPAGTEELKPVYSSLSDQNKLLVTDIDGIVYLCNIDDGSLIMKDTLKIGSYPVNVAHLAPDGNTMVAYTNNGYRAVVHYTLDDDEWVETGITEISPREIFYSVDGTSVYISSFSGIEQRKTDDFSLISEYSLPEGYFKSVDLRNKRFLWDLSVDNIQYIVDLETGMILRTSIIDNMGFCRLYDNYIISGYGLQLTIQEFD